MKKLLYFTLLYCASMNNCGQDLIPFFINCSQPLPSGHSFGEISYFDKILRSIKEDGRHNPAKYLEDFQSEEIQHPENNPITLEDNSTPIDFFFAKYLSEFTENNCSSNDDLDLITSLTASENSMASSSTTCDYQSDANENLMPPSSSMHGYDLTKNSFFCVLCGCNGFNDLDIFNIHAQIHIKAPDKTYECKHCSSYFETSDSLTKHLSNHRSEAKRNHPCPYCPFKATKDYKLIQHFEVHIPSPEKIFHCGLCRSFFAGKDRLNTHSRTIHGIKQRPSRIKK